MPALKLRDMKVEHKSVIEKIKALNEKEDRAALTEAENKELADLFKTGTELKNKIEQREKIKELELSKAAAEAPAEKRSFSLSKAIGALIGKNKLDGFEAEACAEAEKRHAQPASGIVIPASALFGKQTPPEKRTIDGQSSLYSNPIMPGELLPALRERSLIGQLGLRMVMASERFNFPVVAGATAGWFSADGGSDSEDEITESDPSFTSISSTPKFLAVMSGWTMAQLKNMTSSLSLEAIVRSDLAAAMSEALDAAVVRGSGASQQPRGIINQAGINKTTKAYQAALSWTYDELLSEIEAMKKAIKLNAVMPRWLINPGVAREWRKTLRFAVNGASQLLTDDNRAAALTAIETNHLNPASPASAGGDVEAVLGDWSQFMFVSYGTVELSLGMIDDDFQKGIQRLRAVMSCDLVLRRSEGFRLMAIDRTA